MNLMLRTRSTGQLNLDRVFARVFVVLGGIFWVAAFFGETAKADYSNFVYTLPELAKASTMSLVLLAVVVAILVLCFFFERLAGLVLVVLAAGMVVWGIVAHWGEVGLWLTAISVLIAPAAISGALFELSSRRQELQEHDAAPMS